MKDATGPAPALEPASLAPVAVSEHAELASGSTAAVPASLPRDHPAWQRDVLAVSARVRAIVMHLHPVAVRVLTFWDHLVRSVSVGGRRVEVDPSGCYRLR